MGTIVMECCGEFNSCNAARGLCKHFYDSAPGKLLNKLCIKHSNLAGEYGSCHYLIRALLEIFGPTN